MNSVRDNPCGLGFPIRKSAGQRVLASHRSLSQRATSFIACVRQGIPRTPLLKRLIAQHFVPCPERRPALRGVLAHAPQDDIRSELDDSICDQSWCLFGSTGRANRLTPPSQCQRSCDAHDRANYARGVHRSCLFSPFRIVAEFGGADRDRTDDLKLAKLPLSQLSYGPGADSDGGPGTS